eukprot:TRINITY_DN287_c0_g1_i11.p1 TRINITY_DN287_c0_g1~~TRINITY_DN287_c0_g1_i11.p1  ORF type:complete len:1636 (+),score=389.53 TRINITY_DN287_c0_g1_i11:477-5384(+)
MIPALARMASGLASKLADLFASSPAPLYPALQLFVLMFSTLLDVRVHHKSLFGPLSLPLSTTGSTNPDGLRHGATFQAVRAFGQNHELIHRVADGGFLLSLLRLLAALRVFPVFCTLASEIPWSNGATAPSLMAAYVFSLGALFTGAPAALKLLFLQQSIPETALSVLSATAEFLGQTDEAEAHIAAVHIMLEVADCAAPVFLRAPNWTILRTFASQLSASDVLAQQPFVGSACAAPVEPLPAELVLQRQPAAHSRRANMFFRLLLLHFCNPLAQSRPQSEQPDIATDPQHPLLISSVTVSQLIVRTLFSPFCTAEDPPAAIVRLRLIEWLACAHAVPEAQALLCSLDIWPTLLSSRAFLLSGSRLADALHGLVAFPKLASWRVPTGKEEGEEAVLFCLRRVVLLTTFQAAVQSQRERFATQLSSPTATLISALSAYSSEEDAATELAFFLRVLFARLNYSHAAAIASTEDDASSLIVGSELLFSLFSRHFAALLKSAKFQAQSTTTPFSPLTNKIAELRYRRVAIAGLRAVDNALIDLMDVYLASERRCLALLAVGDGKATAALQPLMVTTASRELRLFAISAFLRLLQAQPVASTFLTGVDGAPAELTDPSEHKSAAFVAASLAAESARDEREHAQSTAARAVAAAKYCELLSDSRTDVDVVLDLLEGLLFLLSDAALSASDFESRRATIQTLAGNSALASASPTVLLGLTRQQQRLREAGAFMHIGNVLNTHQSEAVLTSAVYTFIWLMVWNRENKDHFSSTIGFDQLSRLIINTSKVVPLRVFGLLFDLLVESIPAGTELLTAEHTRLHSAVARSATGKLELSPLDIEQLRREEESSADIHSSGSSALATASDAIVAIPRSASEHTEAADALSVHPATPPLRRESNASATMLPLTSPTTRSAAQSLFDAATSISLSASATLSVTNSTVLAIIVRLLPSAESAIVRAAVLHALSSLVELSEFNKTQACSVGLFGALFTLLPQELDFYVYVHILRLMRQVGSHSISVTELKQCFQLQQIDKDGFRPRYTPDIVKTLSAMVAAVRPTMYFDFNSPDAALIVPTLDDWPSITGWSFCTWLRVESYQDALGRAEYHPRLFSFFGESGKGFEAVFRNKTLFLSVNLGPGHLHEAELRFNFQPKRWYFLCLSHACASSVFSVSEIRMYVNDLLACRCALKFPSFGEKLTRCAIGTSTEMPPSNERHSLCGQMGSIYFFDDVVSASQALALYHLGANYNSCFQATDVEAVPKQFKSILDGEVTSWLTLAYNCKAVHGRTVLDNTPARASVGSLPAELGGSTTPSVPPQPAASASGLRSLTAKTTSSTKGVMATPRHARAHGVHFSVTRPFHDMLQCLGGVQALLPLVAQIDQPLAGDPPESGAGSKGSTTGDLSQILELLLRVLQNRTSNQEDMLNCHGIECLGFILRQLSPLQFTLDTVKVVKALVTKLTSADLLNEMVKHLFLDARIWILTAAPVQTSLWQNILDLAKGYTEYFRFVMPVQKLLDILRQFYWYTEDALNCSPLSYMHPVTDAVIATRPGPESIHEIRFMIFAVIRQFFQHTPPTNEELSAMIAYLLDCPDQNQIADLLTVLLVSSIYIFDLLASQETFQFAEPQSHSDAIVRTLRNPGTYFGACVCQ